MKINRNGRLLVGAGAVLALAACASTPPPQTFETLGMAKAAIDAAEQQKAAIYAPELLDQAQSKIIRAEHARQGENYVSAVHLAEQALLDAKLAAVQSNLSTTRLMVDELEAGISILEREIRVR